MLLVLCANRCGRPVLRGAVWPLVVLGTHHAHIWYHKHEDCWVVLRVEFFQCLGNHKCSHTRTFQAQTAKQSYCIVLPHSHLLSITYCPWFGCLMPGLCLHLFLHHLLSCLEDNMWSLPTEWIGGRKERLFWVCVPSLACPSSCCFFKKGERTDTLSPVKSIPASVGGRKERPFWV